MTTISCDAMLDLLLEADLDELAGVGSSPVASHVRTCTRCGRVAAQLVADTRALAVRLGEPAPIPRGVAPRGPTGRRAATIGGVLAAGLAAVVALQLGIPSSGKDSSARGARAVAGRTDAPPPVPASDQVARLTASSSAVAPSPAPAASVQGELAAAVAAATPRAAPPAGSRPAILVRQPNRPGAVASVPRAFAPATAVAPVLLAARDISPGAPDTTARAADRSITVEPELGRRAAILRPADPGITVVWLY